MKNILYSGAVVNAALIIAGALIGTLLKKGIPERLRKTILAGTSLCVLYVGITGIFQSVEINALIVVISLAIGAVAGELINLDRLVNKLGEKAEKKFGSGGNSRIAEGFVTATLVFCVGAMSVIGSIDSGIRGDNTVLYSKALIDGVIALAFASSLGAGVALSAAPVLVLEGSLTLLASAVAPALTENAVAHMSVIGSLLIIGIAFNMLELTKIKVMNLLPAVFLPLVLCLFM